MHSSLASRQLKYNTKIPMPLSISLTDRLQHQHETILDLIEGFTEAQLKERVVPEKWSAFENIVHLSEIIGLPLQIKQLANSVNFDMLYRLRFLA